MGPPGEKLFMSAEKTRFIDLLEKYRRILSIILGVFIPVFVIFAYEAVITTKYANRATQAVEEALPGALAYVQLERSVMNMQKWLTYVAATRNQLGYYNGFQEAEKYYGQSMKDLATLERLFRDNAEELKRITDLRTDIKNYYEAGREVAQAYVEQGHMYGNAMLEVSSTVERELNDSLRRQTRRRTDETVSINLSIKDVLKNNRIVFIFLGIVVIVLAVISFNFLMNRQELDASHEKLSKAMDLLWGEMELAKKIQTVLLPDDPKIAGYEISAYMKPADEVGGDYYDIIRVDDRDWLVIGDVSGHGIPAGLIMMMVQTSIHTVLHVMRDARPSEILSRVNTVISENIRKLGEDKYMTITVMACIKNGMFNFSGLHQDILVYRSRSGVVEELETRGFWIGIYDDINEMLDDDILTLEIGDTMLVYTDGITEAWIKGSVRNKRTIEADMYGQERLREILSRIGDRPPEAVREGILESLKDYQASDDITMVVVKRVE